MATGAAAGDGFLRGVFEGCISGRDMSIQRRPYHKNCGCAFHKSGSSRGHCSHLKNNVVSYPIRRSWSEGSLALMGSSSSSWSSSTTTSPAVPGEKIRRAHTQLVLCEDDDQELALVPTKKFITQNRTLENSKKRRDHTTTTSYDATTTSNRAITISSPTTTAPQHRISDKQPIGPGHARPPPPPRRVRRHHHLAYNILCRFEMDPTPDNDIREMERQLKRGQPIEPGKDDFVDAGCIMLPNKRPLVIYTKVLKFEGGTSFVGHLAIDKARHQIQREMKDVVSTFHYSQNNTIEYEMTMAGAR